MENQQETPITDREKKDQEFKAAVTQLLKVTGGVACIVAITYDEDTVKLFGNNVTKESANDLAATVLIEGKAGQIVEMLVRLDDQVREHLPEVSKMRVGKALEKVLEKMITDKAEMSDFMKTADFGSPFGSMSGFPFGRKRY